MKIFVSIYVLGCIAAYVITLRFAVAHKRKYEKTEWTELDAIWLALYTFGSWITFLTIFWCHYKYIKNKNQS
jgi:hypothetical protein